MKGQARRRQQLAWIALALLAATVGLLGGSSRPDAVQNVALRPMAALLLVPALYQLQLAHLCSARIPSILFGALTVWTAVQLVPLPPSLWQSLPGRSMIAELDALIGFDGIWRPISLVPHRGWNALAALVVPLAALLLALSSRAGQTPLLLIITGVGLVNALVGLLQVTGASALYFYSYSTPGMPAGLFANENHASVFSAITLLVLAKLRTGPERASLPGWLQIALVPTFVVVLLAVLVGGSRGGLALSGVALLLAGVMAWLTTDVSRRRKRKGQSWTWLTDNRRIGLLGFFAAIVAALALFLGFDRAAGFEGWLATSAFEDLRWHLWPIILQMLGDHFTIGIGFGAFEDVYQIYEPTSLLMPQYVNQAHNDWAQVLIEGGLPALAILIVLLGWIVRSIYCMEGASRAATSARLFWCGVFLVIGTSSIVDYPLRTPIFQVAGVWLLICLAQGNAHRALSQPDQPNTSRGESTWPANKMR